MANLFERKGLGCLRDKGLGFTREFRGLARRV